MQRCKEKMEEIRVSAMPFNWLWTGKQRDISQEEKAYVLRIEGIMITDSESYAASFYACEQMKINHVKVVGHWKYSNDGIDFINCRNVSSPEEQRSIKNIVFENINVISEQELPVSIVIHKENEYGVMDDIVMKNIVVNQKEYQNSNLLNSVCDGIRIEKTSN